MKKIILVASIIFAAITANSQTFTLKSNEMGGQLTNKQVFAGFGCKGENISPQLFWENAPKGTKSFAVTVYDSKAPTGSGWWHWVAFNIPANTNELKSNAGNPKLNLAPNGTIQSITDFGTKGFGGACPPKGNGEHPYIFTVYALSIDKINLPSNTPAAQVNYFINASTIGKATIVSYYKR
ncbi:YbhB/YbcL family Raf kinase inhibitor-like protein [Tenacibaculum ovolyticum]|uniref:YbhB/YbcL family Raf kinase inhibitor-like protein n=1 Tax=Tenacibaculum ovolyticum TaxID=104270 RepID=UPI0022F391F2|nr:YbhB/YbcL family Raf kinase inhibitor-like protein [Tenacibaculum ovolyticum]WBX78060.1 YbhB/YbcL family Raf kinase inhibitor-like protein [Tenacibaculum ovolyticum]